MVRELLLPLRMKPTTKRFSSFFLLLFCYPLLVMGGFLFWKSIFYAIVYIICGRISSTVISCGRRERGNKIIYINSWYKVICCLFYSRFLILANKIYICHRWQNKNINKYDKRNKEQNWKYEIYFNISVKEIVINIQNEIKSSDYIWW